MLEATDTSKVLRFGSFELDSRAHELRNQGVRVRLQDQPFQILRHLVRRSGEVVTREQLRQLIWPSSVHVDFDHGVNNAIARLRDALGDTAGTPRFIETLPRIGYRFICPVESVALEPRTLDPEVSAPKATSPAPIAPTDSAPPVRRRWLTAAAIGLLVVLGVLLSSWLSTRPAGQSRATSALRDPSIAVLPFTSLSSDPENEYFSDGLTEELVTKLAGIRGIKVVARTSSFRFKGKQASAAAIAQALQVNLLLEGSVRRSANRMRITAQLIDARKDEHLWSQTFDRDIGDIFQVQQEIAFAVAAALKLSLLDSDEFRMRKHGTTDPEAYRLYLIAQAHLLSRARPSNPDTAKRALDAALARDPNFAAAHAGLARYYFARAWGTLTEPEESARLGIAEAERAVTLDPTSSDAAQARANFQFWHYRFGGDYQAFLAAQSGMHRAIELDPSNSLAFYDFGRAILWDEPDLASSLLEQSMQIDLLCTGPNIQVAVISGSRGQLESARKRCEDLLKRYPDAAPCRMAMATLDSYFGNFEPAVALLRASEKSIGGSARIQLWSVYMSLGDRADALHFVDFGSKPFERDLSGAARFAMDGRYDLAFTALEQHRAEYPLSHLLDYPSARFALIAGKPRAALEILQKRMPDLVNGVEPISARNLLPAIDLATAQLNSGERDESRALLRRIAIYLDGATALRLPLFTFERARVHALAGESEAALRSLEHAYEAGLRTTWALDLRPESLLYIDPLSVDPSLSTLRSDPRYMQWLEQIAADNAHQLEVLRTHEATRPTG